MDPVEKAVDLIKRYALLAYLSNGKCLGSDIKGKRVYLSGPITNTKNYKGLFMFAEELAALGDAEQIYNPAAQISASSSSRGARLESDVALACGIHVVNLSENKITYGLYNSLKETLEKLL